MYLINTKESLRHVVVKLRELSLANRKRDDKANSVSHRGESVRIKFTVVTRKVAIHYAWCMICLRIVCNSQIKGRIANHQQTRVYTLFAIRSFPVNKFSMRFQKKCEYEFFLWWCVKLPPWGEIARITMRA